MSSLSDLALAPIRERNDARAQAALGRRDATRALLAVADQSVISAASFGASLLIGRFGSPGALGIYFLSLNLVLLARGIQEQLIGAPYVVLSARRQGSSLARYTASTLVHQLLFVLLVGALMTCLLTFAPGFSAPPWPQTIMAILVLTAPGLMLREFVRQIALARLDMASVLTLDCCVASLQMLLLAAVMLLGELAPAAALAAIGASALVGSLGWWSLRRPALVFDRSALAPDWQSNWTFGRWALASHLLSIAAPQILPWMLLWSHGETSAGTLAAAMSLVGLSNVISNGIGNYLSPRSAQAFARGGVAELKGVLSSARQLYALCLGALCLAMWLAGEWCITTLYGPRYAGAGVLVAILMTSALVNALGMVAGNGLWAMHRPQANFVADCVQVAVALMVALTWLQSGGVLAIGIATLAAAAFGCVVRFMSFHRVLREYEPQAGRAREGMNP